MTALIDKNPYEDRDEPQFLQELTSLVNFHREHCPEYAKLLKGKSLELKNIEDFPFIHVGIFKKFSLFSGVGKKGRTLLSSATSGQSSKIILDEKSSALQTQSTEKIFSDFIGNQKCPILVVDSFKSLQSKGEISARVAAALSLKQLALSFNFVLDDAFNAKSLKIKLMKEIAAQNDQLIIYGFSWILYQFWNEVKRTPELHSIFFGKTIFFVHSGGWKKLEDLKVSEDVYNHLLLQELSPKSKVINFYGLVEQVGIIYPLCEAGRRHVPLWADVLVRDSFTLKNLLNGVGQLQLINTISFGSPNHSVLTEDMGKLFSNTCPCGRKGKTFELIGRIPKAEVRGCANV